MRALKSFLQKKKTAVSQKLPKQELDEKTVFYLWQKVVEREYGKQGVNNIRFGFYKNRILFLKIASSNWRNEIWLQKDFLREELNKKIGEKEVKKIVVKND